MTNDGILVQICLASRVDAAIVDRIVVALAQEVCFELACFFVKLLLQAGNTMHNRNVLPIDLVDDDVANGNLAVLEEYQNVASVHGRFHRAGQYDHHR